MQVRIYTEQVYRKIPRVCYFFGEPNPPHWIRTDQLVNALNSAALPGSDHSVFVVVSNERAAEIIAGKV